LDELNTVLSETKKKMLLLSISVVLLILTGSEQSTFPFLFSKGYIHGASYPGCQLALSCSDLVHTCLIRHNDWLSIMMIIWF